MKAFRIVVLCAVAADLSACTYAFDQYVERKDSITFAHGDAVSSNIAVQTADPWPRRSQDNNIPMDPVKADRAIQQYRLGDYGQLTGIRGGGGGYMSSGMSGGGPR